MTEYIHDTLLQSREEAGLLLGMKLREYENTNAVVIGIPNSGVCVAAAIAKCISLPLEVIPGRRIKHPANDNRNLGSVSLTEVFLHDNAVQVPQEFVARQILSLKNANSIEHQFYHDGFSQQSLKYKTVILVDDLLRSSEVMLACVHEIKKQKPMKIVVAVPVVSAEAARIVGNEVDDTIFLRMEQEIGEAKHNFKNYHRIDRDQVKRLLDASQKNLH
jgi:predicted phosphoribosyltransferase